MTSVSPDGTGSPSTWADWAEATSIQRDYFKTLPAHLAWSRLCSSCGQGDFLERKQKPNDASARLLGRGFPALPEPVEDPPRKPRRFRTPASRIHICMPSTPARR